MGEKVEYVCNLCPDDPYSSSDRTDVKRHVSRSRDAHHKDRKGSDPGAIIEAGEADAEEPGAEADAGGRVRVESGAGTYDGPATGLDMTMSHLSEANAGDTAHTGDIEEATLVALTDDQLVELLSADTVSDETKLAVLDQIRGD